MKQRKKKDKLQKERKKKERNKSKGDTKILSNSKNAFVLLFFSVEAVKMEEKEGKNKNFLDAEVEGGGFSHLSMEAVRQVWDTTRFWQGYWLVVTSSLSCTLPLCQSVRNAGAMSSPIKLASGFPLGVS